MSLSWQSRTERPRQALLQIPINEDIALRLATEYGDQRAKDAGREYWDESDFNAAEREYERLLRDVVASSSIQK